ncbi:MAG: pyridoxal phosphate enzyme (YggS family) [Granulosicoccus sp.]
MNETTPSLPIALQQVTQQITKFAQKYHRESDSVSLLAVSKRKPVAAIQAAIQAGQRSFGENYVDEGVEKILTLASESLDWHFIGAIQSRKCQLIATHFDWVHSVDRLKVAKRLSDSRPSDKSPLNICLQVNLDNEDSKSGLLIDQVGELALACSVLPGLRVRGLMAIPAPRVEFDEQRKVFATLRNLLGTLQADFPELDTLSMGMSGDMEAAICEGATIVRVGTAIFGARDH